MSNNNLQKYTRLKKEAETAQQEADRAEGALDQLKTSLKDEFGCSTIEKAKTLLTKLKRKEQDANTEFEEALETFENEWESEE